LATTLALFVGHHDHFAHANPQKHRLCRCDNGDTDDVSMGSELDSLMKKTQFYPKLRQSYDGYTSINIQPIETNDSAFCSPFDV
jgi:hypothetical protein